jgi:uncharacterized protein YuzE
MNKEFIPYDQALELKELGFDDECLLQYNLTYDEDDKTIGVELFNASDCIVTSSRNYPIKAPLYQQAFRWFREKHTYQCYIQFMNNSYAYWIGIKSIDFYYHSFNSTPRDMKIDSSWETYEEAELECLKKLIEIVKNK